ncbi:hypothetical protein OSH11_04090 [Kaistia dalseonensis]|uniref:Lipoprotein n=1 Tax=Kaistia dalseonensis TaxID=410840 RepID=A0ABU0H2B3_9HYPH|nr:hypothetical protein [Kaistia dalseonensis]MCX5493875.1 hypothetical protein [Kaistia dalseonensis]MDQ0436441.1 hypothetical protein [Kaistia dalseonensis]
MSVRAALASALILATAGLAQAASEPAAVSKDGFRLVQIGKDGTGCLLLNSDHTGKPITQWNKKAASVTAFAIGEGKSCPYPFTIDGQTVPLKTYPSYSINNFVFTAYTKTMDKQVITRKYGSNYLFKWVKSSTAATTPAATTPAAKPAAPKS